MIFWLCGGPELNFVKAVLFVERDFAFEFQFGFFDFLQKLFEGFLVFEVGFFFEAAFGQQFDEAGLAQAAAEFCGSGLIFLNVEKKCGQAGAFERLTPSLALTTWSSVARFISS